MSDDDTNTVLEPYREKTIMRHCKIQVKDGHSFYVNHYLLGEQSPVFVKMFFGEFKEAHDLEAHLPDESVESLNLLFSTLGMGYPLPKEISDGGLLELLRMAHMYDMEGLRKRCADYIRKRVSPKETMDSEELIWMCTLLQFLIDDGDVDYDDAKLGVADSIASVTIAQLTNICIWEQIKEPHFLKEILETSSKNTVLFRSDSHFLEYDAYSSSASKCGLCSPPRASVGNIRCSKCRHRLCMMHLGNVCTKKPDKLQINRRLFK